MSDWRLTVKVSATSYDRMKAEFAAIAKDIDRARTYRELPIMGCGSDSSGFNVTCESPAEARIEQLRKEADELEATIST